MKTKKLLFGTLAGTVTMFLFGFIIYGVVLAGYMAAHANPAVALPMEQMKFPVMVLSNLVWALLISILIDRTGSQNMMAGAKIGALTGFLALLGLGLTLFATSTLHNNNATYMIVDTVAFGVLAGITGAVSGWVMQKAGAKSAAVA
jgi:hypothetical protein